MLRTKVPIFLFLTLSFSVLGGEPEFTVLEDFQIYVVGSVPKDGWKTREGDAKAVYEIKSEEGGNRFLSAKDAGQSVQFFKDQKWSLKDFPALTWRWRVTKFPIGSDEKKGKNDSAAGIYVVFPRRFFVPQAIKYVWSEKVPVNTIVVRHKQFPIIVVRSGTKLLGQWQNETRNVSEDYQEYFKESPPSPVAIGFLTDANDTKSIAQADYDDIKAVKALRGH